MRAICFAHLDAQVANMAAHAMKVINALIFSKLQPCSRWQELCSIRQNYSSVLRASWSIRALAEHNHNLEGILDIEVQSMHAYAGHRQTQAKAGKGSSRQRQTDAQVQLGVRCTCSDSRLEALPPAHMQWSAMATAALGHCNTWPH